MWSKTITDCSIRYFDKIILQAEAYKSPINSISRLTVVSCKAKKQHVHTYSSLCNVTVSHLHVAEL